MDVNKLAYQLRSKADWRFKLALLQQAILEREAKAFANGWNECSSTLSKSRQIMNKLFEEDFKNELEQLRDYVCSIKNKKEIVRLEK